MSVLIRAQPPAAVYVAATRQHVGKTSTCLGLLKGLTSRLDRIGFFKPVGQESIAVEGGTLHVDKDVAVAKDEMYPCPEVFQLDTCNYADMSPVVMMPGYTKRFLEGSITVESQLRKIQSCFDRIMATNEFTVVEGTGHTGVGSIVGCNNAQIASELGIDMILIANGGLGSAFDDLALNYAMCQAHNVKIRGVILNKVRPDRIAMVKEYFPKALKHWKVPLVGVVPNLSSLSHPSMLDFEGLFQTRILSSRARRFQQYNKTTLVTAGLRRFLTKLSAPEYDHTMFVTHVSRNDIILGLLSHAQNFELTEKRPYGGGLILTGSPARDQPQDYLLKIIQNAHRPYGGGLILTGSPARDQPQDYLLKIIQNAHVPVLYVPITTFKAMEKITHFTAKFNPTDKQKVHACGEHYASHIDFEAILAN
ncbi:uncharacterized protein CCR75_007817 [Bremia lactucae]|uniref:DRTGG domain-containing protein n=1 Tax=Bremia lactucae TaxID=4779 RepID=A0A976IM12_BRELC|nr:hypothetical protein CCR75_007817 [Bremia lactucae]